MKVKTINLFRLIIERKQFDIFMLKKIFNLSLIDVFFSSSYFIIDNTIKGIKKNNRYYIYIKGSNTSVENLVNSITTYYNNTKFYLEIKYIKSNIDTNNISNKCIIQKNFKTMEMDLNKYLNFFSFDKYSDINVLNIDINKNMDLRIDIQNSIFNSNDRKRRPIDKNYLYKELNSRYFLKDYCYMLYKNNRPIGYGQVIKDNSLYYLVNFGIIEEYRGRGYAYLFLNYILNDIKRKKEIKLLQLNVDNNNICAINLYKKVGFIEIDNTIILKSI
ncbi:MAG: GNAT family N-acetyltransferase [Caloramator sp.]|nr:GNAT family N-acetyltransferase [Caloramator sp.]